MNLLNILIGQRLANAEAQGRKITTLEGFAAMGLDGLSSSAYGPEAALVILMAAGSAGLGEIRPVMLAVLLLLLMLFVSYWQTIEAYPSNAGSYTVARENLGANAGLLAATALMIDYVLNVAVGISAGVGALTSAVPPLHPYTLPLCLGILALITIVNLRGTMEAGIIFSVPTYLFVASFGGLLLFGIIKTLGAAGNPHSVVPPPPLPEASEAVTLWLLLRAFASGCTAMTGVEAVSNGVSTFRDPTTKYAHRTLAAIVLTLAVLLAAIAYLAPAYRVVAMDQSQPGYQTVLSQIAAAVVGRGAAYYIAIGSLLAVLCLSANTSFVAFPQLCRIVAQDAYLPRAFTVPGRRLVYSVGILWLTLTAGALLIVFGGITDRLIPLFAVGAFLAFTLSQLGMTVHWHRQQGRPLRLAINGAGALATGAALAVILAAKFVEGAWITVIAIPLVLALLKAIKRYYDLIDQQLREDGPANLHNLPVADCGDAAAALGPACRKGGALFTDLVVGRGGDPSDKARRTRCQRTSGPTAPAMARRCRTPRARGRLDAAGADYLPFALSELCRALAQAYLRDRNTASRPSDLCRNPRDREGTLVGLPALGHLPRAQIALGAAVSWRTRSRRRDRALGARTAAPGKGHRSGGAEAGAGGGGRAGARLTRACAYPRLARRPRTCHRASGEAQGEDGYG